jgi:hypothetical protein
VKLRLADLKPNPWRRMSVDPLDGDHVSELAEAIRQRGFHSGGVVLRKNADGVYEIVSGHHRVAAAMEAGIKEAEFLHVYGPKQMGDAAMVKQYATENTTQRSDRSSALMGIVASATWFLARTIMQGNLADLPPRRHKGSAKSGGTLVTRTEADLTTLRGNILSDKGMGRDIVTDFLADVPGLNHHHVAEFFAGVKASGEYANIIAEVADTVSEELGTDEELAAEAEEAERVAKQADAAKRKAEERARKSKDAKAKANADKAKREAEAAKKKAAAAKAKADKALKSKQAQEAKTKAKAAPVTVDAAVARANFPGSSANREWVSQMRRLTGDDPETWPLKEQGKLAKRVLKAIGDADVTAASVREAVNAIVLGLSTTRFSEKRREAIEAAKSASAEKQLRDLMHNWSRQMGAAFRISGKITDLLQRFRAKGLTMPVTREFANTIQVASAVMERLRSELEQTPGWGEVWAEINRPERNENTRGRLKVINGGGN